MRQSAASEQEQAGHPQAGGFLIWTRGRHLKAKWPLAARCKLERRWRAADIRACGRVLSICRASACV